MTYNNFVDHRQQEYGSKFSMTIVRIILECSRFLTQTRFHRRNCRYSLIPSAPLDPAIVRNFTLMAVAGQDGLESVKKLLAANEMVQEMTAEELSGALDEINEIDENFKRVMFGDWIEGKTGDFQKMKRKLHTKLAKPKHTKKTILENSKQKQNENKEKIGSLITAVKINDTTTLNVAVPSQIRDVLFSGWETLGINFIRILLPYAKSLELDVNLYVADEKFVFHPPVPSYDKSRGFEYKNWSEFVFAQHFRSI